jgi:uncharacterized protein (TIGR00730 family)
MIHVETMHERQAKLIENSCAVIALPGGTGTLDELFDVLSLKKLGLFHYPIIILNFNGFYNSLLELIQRMTTERFLDIADNDLWTIAITPEEVINAIENK